MLVVKYIARREGKGPFAEWNSPLMGGERAICYYQPNDRELGRHVIAPYPKRVIVHWLAIGLNLFDFFALTF
jgi:hypothetical protein